MPAGNFQDLHKIKLKKEQKVKEYFKSFVKGPGLDKIKIPLTSLATTKKKRLHMTPAKKTMKNTVKTTQLAPTTIDQPITNPNNSSADNKGLQQSANKPPIND